MTTGMETDIDNTSDARKTTIINNTLLRFKLDIATFRETSLTGQGFIREKDFMFFQYGKSVDERREHGVGFTVKATLLHHVEVGPFSNERTTTVRLHIKKGSATIASVYAHKLYPD